MAAGAGRGPVRLSLEVADERRLVTVEFVQTQTIQNKRNLEAPDEGFKDSIRAIAADPQRTRDFLIRTSMIASLKRAQELG